ncbi:hypothetical protein FACS189459_4340 [Bacilli bacterium]|nr:hypothetical protein FACS189459_4340 [Bacilli bacterium]
MKTKIFKKLLMPTLILLATTSVITPIISCSRGGKTDPNELKYNGNFTGMSNKMDKVKELAECSSVKGDFKDLGYDTVTNPEMLKIINDNIKPESYFYAMLSTVSGINDLLKFGNTIFDYLSIDVINEIINYSLLPLLPNDFEEINLTKFNFAYSIDNVDILTDVENHMLTKKSHMYLNMHINLNIVGDAILKDESAEPENLVDISCSPEVDVALKVNSLVDQNIKAAGVFSLVDKSTNTLNYISGNSIVIGNNTQDDNIKNFSTEGTKFEIKDKADTNSMILGLENIIEEFVKEMVLEPYKTPSLFPLFNIYSFFDIVKLPSFFDVLFPNVTN